MKYEVHFNDDFFEVVACGDAEPGGIEDFIDLMLGHEKWKPGTNFLVNLSKLNTAPLTVADVRNIAKTSESRKAAFGRAKAATLVDRDLEYGMINMWGVFIDGKWDVTAKPFRSRDEAISWLKNS